MDVVDIDMTSYMAAILVVLGMLGLLAVGLRWLQSRSGMRPALINGRKSLAVLDVLPVDIGQKLVLIRCLDEGYLVLVCRNKESVVVARGLPLPSLPEGERWPRRGLGAVLNQNLRPSGDHVEASSVSVGGATPPNQESQDQEAR